jgi:hypothetical protein
VLTDTGTEEPGAAAGTWMMNLAELDGPPGADEEDCPSALGEVRLDGKAVRGAGNLDGTQVRLLAALAGPGAASSVIAVWAAVGAKTNGVPVAAVVLGQLDLHGKVVTADALRTARRRRAAVPARQPGLPDRVARHRPAWPPGLGRRRARRRQPGTGTADAAACLNGPQPGATG